MSRIRTIKPDFWTDEKVVVLSPLARLFFIGLWNFVDDEGRAQFSPASLKMKILPADSTDASEILGEIRGAGLITVYQVDGKEYFEVCGFKKHQKVDKRAPSKIPPPPGPAELPRIVQTEGNGREGKGEDKTAVAVLPVSPKKYSFEGVVIKLSEKHFADWTKAFSNLDLLAELTARDAWLASDKATEADRKNWFISTSKYLANRNAEARPQVRRNAANQDWKEALA